MKRKKSPHVLRRGTAMEGGATSRQSTPPTSTSSLTSTPGSVHQTQPTHSSTGSTVSSAVHGIQSTIHPPRLPGGHNSSSSTEEHYGYDEQDSSAGGGALMPNGSTDALTVIAAPYVSCASGDECDGGSQSFDANRTRAAIEHIQQKIGRTKEEIKAEQTARDENVNEYLKLASNADKQQLQRIKNVFEKKNQKSAQAIAQLQKKLENYNKRIRDLETHGLSGGHWQPREVLRDVGQGLKDVGANIKEGISGLSGSVMSKPREFAHLIKHRFGSADNISSLDKLPEEGNSEEAERNLHGSATFTHSSTKYTSDDESSSITSGSGQIPGGTTISPRHQQPPSTSQQQQQQQQPQQQQQQQLSVQQVSTTLVATETATTPTVMSPSIDLEPIYIELSERRDECQRLSEEVEALKGQMQQECAFFHQALQEERYRFERLEEQMNDLIELHQNEIENLKQGIADMEEKVQYQSEERLRDVHEVLESCQTRISRMEHQQHQHLQQLVTLDSLENSNARALALKLINVLLTVLQVVLLLVATVANIVMPFLQTRVRIFTTVLLILAVVVMVRHRPELLEWGREHILRHVPGIGV